MRVESDWRDPPPRPTIEIASSWSSLAGGPRSAIRRSPGVRREAAALASSSPPRRTVRPEQSLQSSISTSPSRSVAMTETVPAFADALDGNSRLSERRGEEAGFDIRRRVLGAVNRPLPLPRAHALAGRDLEDRGIAVVERVRETRALADIEVGLRRHDVADASAHDSVRCAIEACEILGLTSPDTTIKVTRG